MRLIMRNLIKWLMVGLATIPGSSAAIIDTRITTELTTESATEPTVETSVEEVEDEVEILIGSNLDPTEKKVLDFFIERGIKDKMALAVLLGNIKQESLFVTNICEGGSRVPYHQCHRGGFGLIQWTTVGRYDGLGRHARNIGGDPSTLETQLSYLVTEPEWLEIEHRFKKEGQSMSYYMNAAYYWLGWGIHGNRTHYAHHYYANMG